MGHGHVDFTKAIESIPGRTVPVQVKIAASALIVVGLVAGAYAFATDPTRAGGALITNFMYFNGIAIGGFMLTPRYDDDPELLRAAVGDLAQCCLEVVEEMKWPDEDLLPRVRA